MTIKDSSDEDQKIIEQIKRKADKISSLGELISKDVKSFRKNIVNPNGNIVQLLEDAESLGKEIKNESKKVSKKIQGVHSHHSISKDAIAFGIIKTMSSTRKDISDKLLCVHNDSTCLLDVIFYLDSVVSQLKDLNDYIQTWNTIR